MSPSVARANSMVLYLKMGDATYSESAHPVDIHPENMTVLADENFDDGLRGSNVEHGGSDIEHG